MEDFIPVLKAGKHRDPSEGACVMEMVSFMSGGEWTDYPECTEPGIARLAQVINDYLSSSDRHLILQHFDRLFGTALHTDLDNLKWQRALYGMLIQPGTLAQFDTKIIAQNYIWKWLDGRTEIFYEADAVLVLKPEYAQEAVDILGEVLDLYDETFGRTNVEKQNLAKLKEIQNV